MNDVRLSVGTGARATVNVQVAKRPPASVALQVTGVSPRGNAAPEAGLHCTATGASPPVVVGAGKSTGKVGVFVRSSTV
jgi:hypothetical protein